MYDNSTTTRSLPLDYPLSKLLPHLLYFPTPFDWFSWTAHCRHRKRHDSELTSASCLTRSYNVLTLAKVKPVNRADGAVHDYQGLTKGCTIDQRSWKHLCIHFTQWRWFLIHLTASAACYFLTSSVVFLCLSVAFCTGLTSIQVSTTWYKMVE